MRFIPRPLRRSPPWSVPVAALLWVVAAVSGEWIVHQISYFLQYGAQFDHVMATTPHHLYMAPLGVALAAVFALALAAVLAAACSETQRFDRMAERLPRGARRLLPRTSIVPEPRTYLVVAASLTLAQTLIYVVQENLEAHAQGIPWPGLSVVFSWDHGHVLPLQLILALLTSAILCVLSNWFRRTEDRARRAAHLVSLLFGHPGEQTRPIGSPELTPNFRLLVGRLCLRSPPLAA